MNEEETTKKQARALADTLASWQEKRPGDLGKLSEHLDFDTATIELKDGDPRPDPPIKELPEKLRDIYREFVSHWGKNLENSPVYFTPQTETPGSITDFLIGLIERRP